MPLIAGHNRHIQIVWSDKVQSIN